VGPAIAAALLQAGANVTLLGQDADRLEHLALRLAASGVLLQTSNADEIAGRGVAIVRGQDAVRWRLFASPNEAEAAALVNGISQSGGTVDIFINNTGAVEPALLSDTSETLWNRVLYSNLTLPFLLIKSVLPGMQVKGWGRIVTVADIAASRGQSGYVAYRAARQGILGLTTALASELGERDVADLTVNAVEVLLPDNHTAPVAAEMSQLQHKLVAKVVELCQQQIAPPSGQLIQISATDPI
jgi:NAD(P)-dependent dehydrogenase (short-subunit alcohol dehydrogenase family)